MTKKRTKYSIKIRGRKKYFLSKKKGLAWKRKIKKEYKRLYGRYPTYEEWNDY